MQRCILLLAFMLSLLISVSGQSAANAPAPPKDAASQSAPSMKADDLLKIRDLQYRQAKNLLEMRQLESRYRQLQSELATLTDEIDGVVAAAGKASGIDATRWIFDTDQLKYVERPNEKEKKPE